MTTVAPTSSALLLFLIQISYSQPHSFLYHSFGLNQHKPLMLYLKVALQLRSVVAECLSLKDYMMLSHNMTQSQMRNLWYRLFLCASFISLLFVSSSITTSVLFRRQPAGRTKVEERRKYKTDCSCKQIAVPYLLLFIILRDEKP